MNGVRLFVHGVGVVSPAGWGLPEFREVWERRRLIEPASLPHPDGRPRPVYRVPPPPVRPPWALHPRMRRASLLSHFALAAGLEALGDGATPREHPGLCILMGVMGGGVIYSERFYGEVLAQPATASPLLFPETVFNAPASHLGAVLGTRARNDTFVSDSSGMITALATAAVWLADGITDACLVVSCEEADWMTAGAIGQFPHAGIPSEGAAALLLRRDPGPVELTGLSSAIPQVRGHDRRRAASAVLEELGAGNETPDGVRLRVIRSGLPGDPDAIERRFGEGLAATGGWACVAAVDALMRGHAQASVALVSGSNLQTVGCAFRALPESIPAL
jgi:hypothetical protein